MILSNRAKVAAIAITAFFIVLFFFPYVIFPATIILVAYWWWYFGQSKCEFCGKRGTVYLVSSTDIKREPAFGLVTRTERETKHVRRSERMIDKIDGEPAKFVTTTKTWQERVPVVRITKRDTYECKSCKKGGFVDAVREEEDFTRSLEDPIIIEREKVYMLKCSHCGTLVDTTKTLKCPSCGAAVLA